jgi:hypothetical protein
VCVCVCVCVCVYSKIYDLSNLLGGMCELHP